MYTGVKCTSFGTSLHLGFGQCPEVSRGSVKDTCLLVSSYSHPSLDSFVGSPPPKCWPLSSQVSIVDFHLLLEAPMPKPSPKSSFFSDIHETKWFYKSDHVFLESWAESSKYSWRAGSIQMASPRLYSPQFFVLTVIYFRGTRAERENTRTWNSTIHNPTANQTARLQGLLSYPGSL